MLAWIGFVLFLTASLFFLFTKRSSFFFLAFAFATLSLLLFLSIPLKFSPLPFFIAAILSVGAFFLPKGAKRLLGALFFLAAFFSLTLSGLIHLSEETPLLTLTLTGESKKKLTTWQNPGGGLREEWLDTWEVVLTTPEGKKIGTYYLFGELVGIRFKVFRFASLFNFFGIPNSCALDALYNGYRTMEGHNTMPHIGYPLPAGSSKLWSYFFYRCKIPFWAKGSMLESSYFPLTDPQGRAVRHSVTLHLARSGEIAYES